MERLQDFEKLRAHFDPNTPKEDKKEEADKVENNVGSFMKILVEREKT